MNIEKKLFPKSDELVVDKEQVGRIQIVDPELDPLNCTISEKNIVEIDVSKYQYIQLSWNNLLTLVDAMIDMNDIYEEEQ